MIMASGVSTAVSKHETLQKKQQHGGGRKIGRIFESIGKYAVDLAVNLSSKAHTGRGKLHKTVQEEIRDQRPLKPCNNSEKPVGISSEKKMQTKMEEMPEEMNTLKHKTSVSSEKMEPMSLNKLPPEQLKEKEFLLPNKKRIMIWSRL